MYVCSACKEQIIWGMNPKTGKRQPFNAEPDPDGNRVMDEFNNVYPITKGEPVPEGMTGPWLPHHATCPYREQFRRPRVKM